MKKVLFSIFAGVLSASMANAQCTPDPSLAGESFGLWPDSLATVYTCVGCGDQTRVVDLVTFTDTVIPFNVIPGAPPTNVTIYIDAFKITDVRNVPSGMTYGTDVESTADANAPWGYWYNGGTAPNQTSTQGCVYINGTEAQWNALKDLNNYGTGRGAVQLEIDVDVRIAGTNPDLSSIIQAGSWMSAIPASLGGGVLTVDDYWLVAQESAMGITQIDENKFMLVGNYPNPFTGFSNIQFNAPYNMAGVEFNVYSVLGSRVHTEKFDAERGVNTIKFDGTQLSSGLYIYTLSDGNTTLTRKMNVK
jgi:hypothetical protein